MNPERGSAPRQWQQWRRWGADDDGWNVVQWLGIGTLVAGGVALLAWLVVAALLIGPLIFWLAWNVLDFGPAVGLPELGFWAIILATLFLVVGWFAKTVIAAIVFLVEPGWFQAEAVLQWPEPTLRNLVAVALLAMLAARPHARRHKKEKQGDT